MGTKLEPLLVKAGQLLAPNHFTGALEGYSVLTNQTTPNKPEEVSVHTIAFKEESDKMLSLDSFCPELAGIISMKAKKLKLYKIVRQNAESYAAEQQGDELVEKR